MKKSFPFFVLFGLFLFQSCVTTTPLMKVEIVEMMDYSQYAKNGFFITEANSVSFEYEPVGIVQVLLLPGEEEWRIENGGCCEPK